MLKAKVSNFQRKIETERKKLVYFLLWALSSSVSIHLKWMVFLEKIQILCITIDTRSLSKCGGCKRLIILAKLKQDTMSSVLFREISFDFVLFKLLFNIKLPWFENKIDDAMIKMFFCFEFQRTTETDEQY